MKEANLLDMQKYNKFYSNNKQNPILPKTTRFNHKKKHKRLDKTAQVINKYCFKNSITTHSNEMSNSRTYENTIHEKSFEERVPENSSQFVIQEPINEITQTNITFSSPEQFSCLNETLIDTKTKQKQISMALLTLFFSRDFSKTGLSKIIELTQIFSDVKLP